MPRTRKIGLVVQRYGAEVTGGSEHLCRLVAQQLCRHYDVEVITCCALDYLTWADHYPDGVMDVEGIRVRRFRVDRPRDVDSFARSCGITFDGVSHAKEVEWMKAQGPYSTALFRHLEQHGHEYDLFLFFTYLYCTTYFGLPLVKDRALLIPTAHDEPPIYLGIFDELFSQVRHSLFLTPEEEEFVYRRFHLPNGTGELLPVGIDAAPPAPPDVDLPAGLSDGKYIVYVGRVDVSKGCTEMIEHFIRLQNDTPRPEIKLAVVGREASPMPRHESVLMLGYQDDAVKQRVLEGALALIAPSPYESLCIAAIEGWHAGMPVIANGRCEVLKGQCRRTQGGLWYTSYDEFLDAVTTVLTDESRRRALGDNGRRYVQEHYGREHVAERYRQIVERFAC